MMKTITPALLLVMSNFVYADNVISGAPSWSTPSRGIAAEPSETSNISADKRFTLEGSYQKYTQEEIDNKFSAPDWLETDHDPMPRIVQYGKKPKVWACASCHLASGLGHPESSTLTGLTAPYIEQQLEDYSSGKRLDYSGHMNRMAPLLTAQERKEAAAWFASLKPQVFLDVIETDTVPVTIVDDTRMRLVQNAGGLETINGRIIEVAEDAAQVKLRAPYSKFISYVPKGSIARGKNIVTTGGGKTAPCIACHGADLKGTNIAPMVAGNFGTYTVRQLYGFKAGTRQSVQMAPIVAGLNKQDIVDVAAYLASLSGE
jgi:cytochrome c553